MDAGAEARPWYRRHARLLVAAAALAVVAVLVVQAYRKDTSELPVYTLAGDRMAQGQEIYRPDEPKPFTYPPFFALPFVPFRWLPEAVHRGVFVVVNVAALALVFRLLWRLLAPIVGARDRRAQVAYWVLVLLLSSRHLTSVLENQSHDLLVLLPLLAGVVAWARGRCVGTGAGVGLAVAAKATPLVFVPVLAWQRHYKAAAVAVAALVVATLLPDWLCPRADGGSWVGAWADTFLEGLTPGEAATAEGAWSSWNKLNQSLSGTLYRLSFFEGPAREHYWDVRVWAPSVGLYKVVLYGLQLALIGATAFLCLPRFLADVGPGERGFRVLGQAGLLVCCMVLLSPMSSKSHFCVLLLPIAFAGADFVFRRRDPALLVLFLVLLALGPLSSKGVLRPFFGKDLGVGPTSAGDLFLARGSVTGCALAAWLAAGHALFHRARAARRQVERAFAGTRPAGQASTDASAS
ncbi:MAG: glycosyltransferase family 87 protein [Planctomycetota bacterium]